MNYNVTDPLYSLSVQGAFAIGTEVFVSLFNVLGFIFNQLFDNFLVVVVTIFDIFVYGADNLVKSKASQFNLAKENFTM